MIDILYNDFEPFACSWLNYLMFDGLIPIGHVSKKSIKDIQPSEVADFRQVHLFAGIGGWSHALELAGWPEDRQVWTGSCPCQPFSNAGKRKGTNDERHLWPDMRRLISECRPTTIFGEQVASKSGRDWLASVRSDLEALGYAVGCADLCGASVGAPHIRQRLFWVANSDDKRLNGIDSLLREETRERGPGDISEITGGSISSLGLADSDGGKSCNGDLQRSGQYGFQSEGSFDGSGLADSDSSGSEQDDCQIKPGPASVTAWSNVEYINCKDEKARPVMPGVRLLANGFPNRVGLLRGFGNAIIPQVAAVFIRSFLDTER